jgi:uncharacterized Ntn-hydrolase superfamily protein
MVLGIAGASRTDFVFGIAGVAPGKGVIAAQAMSNTAAKGLGVRMLEEGASPQQVIAAITRPDFDPNFDLQQYGVAALGFENRPAAYTGEGADGWKGSAQGCLLHNITTVILVSKGMTGGQNRG